MLELKPIDPGTIARALDKAERYRLLNEPRAAESICLDVIAIEPTHQQAITCLLLSLSDQFGHGASSTMAEARLLLPRLTGEYERAYYAGLISERFARHQVAQDHPGAGHSAYEYVLEAIDHYARADRLAPDGNDDAVLRHNTCVRMIQRHRLVPAHRDEREQPLE